MMDSLFDASVLLLLFIIIYFTVMSVYKFYISMKYYNELDEYRKHKLMGGGYYDIREQQNKS